MFNDLDAVLTRNELVGNSGAPRNGAAENKVKKNPLSQAWRNVPAPVEHVQSSPLR